MGCRISFGCGCIGGRGLGLIGAANAPAEWVREQIQKVKELTKKPLV